LRLYEQLSNQHPRPFNWKFDRAQLEEFLRRLEAKRATQNPAVEDQIKPKKVEILAA